MFQEKYNYLNSDFTKREQRPVIGITGNYENQKCTIAEGYYQSVLQAGGIPVIIPPFRIPNVNGKKVLHDLEDYLDSLDGILFSGGGDINPLLLGEQPILQLHSVCPERDEQELLLARLAADRQIPILGICKGIQVITAALGGELYQDIYSQAEGVSIKHSQDMPREDASHTIQIDADTMLHEVFQQDEIAVNSFHHQAVKSAAPGMRVSARSTDGVIEAVESTEYKSILAVQWHPECLQDDYANMVATANVPLASASGSSAKPLFAWLVREATSFKAAKRIHERVLSLDSHCDTPMFFSQNIDFASRDPKILVDLHKMTEGKLDSTIMVAYLQQQERDEVSLQNATAKANRILTQIEDMVAKNCTAVEIAYTPDDLYRLKHEGKKAIMLGIENGYAVGLDLSNVEKFRKRGVVYMTLCHNGDNDICDSARGNHEHNGVSEFGAKVIREMNRVGMIVDLSHGGEKSFYDAIDISSLPIVCSHSSSRALCDHPRNLTDEQMRVLAKSGGVAQVTLYHGFLRPDPEPATILDAIEHLNHAVNVMGIEHVGIGTDFDGDGGITGCASASELINFTRRLLRERYNEKDIELIWGGNFLRVMRQVQAAARQLPTS